MIAAQKTTRASAWNSLLSRQGNDRFWTELWRVMRRASMIRDDTPRRLILVCTIGSILYYIMWSSLVGTTWMIYKTTKTSIASTEDGLLIEQPFVWWTAWGSMHSEQMPTWPDNLCNCVLAQFKCRDKKNCKPWIRLWMADVSFSYRTTPSHILLKYLVTSLSDVGGKNSCIPHISLTLHPLHCHLSYLLRQSSVCILVPSPRWGDAYTE